MKRKRNNLIGIFVVSLATIIFLDIPVYPDHNSELKEKRNKQTPKFLDTVSIGNIPEEKKSISLEVANWASGSLVESGKKGYGTKH